jgi:O-antigen/teichoic acid export membrane protein
LSTDAAVPSPLQSGRSALRRHSVGRLIAQTAGFNVAAAAAAAVGGVVLARAAGPVVRGEYAAVTAWFGVLQIVGEVGQSAAICFYTARDPEQARDYVATSQTMMLVTSSIAVLAGILVAPYLARGYPGLAGAYRIAFAGSVFSFVGTSYLFSLQARATRRWNLVCLSQPVLGLLGITLLWGLHRLTVGSAVDTLVVTLAIQLGYAYYWCRRSGLTGGRLQTRLVRPLAVYGLSQFAAITPAVLNMYLDQLVLSQLVPPAALGRYAIAVSVTMIPVPLVCAIGNVVFPRLAAQRTSSAQSRRLQRLAVLTSGLFATAAMLFLAVTCSWLIPACFGPAYRGAVPLVWLLAPGGVFLCCGQVAGDLLRGLNRPNFAAAAQGTAAVFTVILLFALLPVLGVAAAAIATTVAYGVALVVMIRLLWQRPRAGKHARKQPEGRLCVSGSSAHCGQTPFLRTSSRRYPPWGTVRLRSGLLSRSATPTPCAWPHRCSGRFPLSTSGNSGAWCGPRWPTSAKSCSAWRRISCRAR